MCPISVPAFSCCPVTINTTETNACKPRVKKRPGFELSIHAGAKSAVMHRVVAKIIFNQPKWLTQGVFLIGVITRLSLLGWVGLRQLSY